MTPMPTSNPPLPCRAEFPLFEAHPKVTYLNSSLQQPVSRTVHEACVRVLDQHMLEPNPKAGWLKAVEVTRSAVENLLGAEKDSVAFTKNTSEGLNSFIHSLNLKPGDNILVLDGEHPNQVYAWMNLFKKGIQFKRIPQVNWASAETFEPYVDENTKAIGLSWVMFHSGQRNDVPGICAKYRPLGIHVLVDATQALGFIDLRLSSIHPSAVAMGCHKGMRAPSGIGLLYVDPQIIQDLQPTYIGPSGLTDCPASLIAGEGLENMHRSSKRFEMGNVNHVALTGLMAYSGLIERVGGQGAIEEYLYSLSGKMIDGAKELGVETVAEREDGKRSPSNTIFKLTHPRWDELFAQHKIVCVRYREGTRVSLGMYNDERDIERFLSVLKVGLSLIPLATA